MGTVRGGSGLPPGRGRGSSVSSIICYLIGLSHVDPVKNRLFFRRFLNEDLQAVPDIDLDFARDIREQLILQVYQRYGHEHAALVCAFATYHLRSAVRDLGKVLGLPAPAIDKLARLSEGGSASSVRRELATLPEFQGQAEGPMWAHLMDLAEQIDGFPQTRRPARGRDDHLVAPGGRAGAGPAGVDGRPLHLPVGQGLVRRRALHQDRFSGAGDAVADRGVPGADLAVPRRKARREHDCRTTTRPSTTRSAMATRSACSRSKAGRRSRC